MCAAGLGRGRMLARGRSSTGDFARPTTPGCRRSAAMAAAGARDGCGFGHAETPTYIHLDCGAADLVPTSQLAEGDAEAIGDGDQCIATPRGVDDGVSRRCSSW